MTLLEVRQGPGRVEVCGPDGLTVELRPGRGLDIGAAALAGVRLAWVSPVVAPTPFVEDPEHADWMSCFDGGLLVTCGLRNVGQPADGHGLHGRFSLRAVSGLDIRQTAEVVQVSGTVSDGPLSCARTVTVRAREGRIEVRDEVGNDGDEPEQAPMLYHVNLGAPFLDEGTTLEVPGGHCTARPGDGPVEGIDWRHPARQREPTDVVLEHTIEGLPRSVIVTSPHVGRRLTLTWSGLHRLHQWINVSPAFGVTSLEPANCSVLGRAADRAAGTAPLLPPGQRRTTTLTLEARRA